MLFYNLQKTLSDQNLHIFLRSYNALLQKLTPLVIVPTSQVRVSDLGD